MIKDTGMLRGTSTVNRQLQEEMVPHA